MVLSPPPITLADAQAKLAAWQTALEAASTGASYSVEGQTVTRQDVDVIRAEIQRWHNTVTALQQRLSGGTIRPLGAQASFPTPGSGAWGIIPGTLWTDGRT